MSRATPILALGLVFLIGGIALFAFAMRQKDAAEGAKAPRKSDLRNLEIEKKNNVKLRIAGGVLAGFGAILAILAGTS
ncbi:MAG: hypothetical protein NTV51_27015 [Verrucomicrobia bacterium]|nr:hypothetical protein [Verrucomicrobiota bacterium]